MQFDPPITTVEIKALADLTSADLTPFINVAQVLVDTVLGGTTLAPVVVRTIGIYLAAHFAFLKEGQIKSEKIGDSSTTYNIESGQGLSSTTYGQMALALDTTKKLAKANSTTSTLAAGTIEFC